ncbi:hypothetical protein [Lysinibacillus sp. NPDC093688]|uniref:hypothetical protein n=1 Tax=Lysinibacillus sp. NPDC093688 TaxID=3390577 RepID=UPI003CFD5F8D
MAQAVHQMPPGSFALCESVATATTNVFCSESKAAATKRPVGTEIKLHALSKSETLLQMTPYHNKKEQMKVYSSALLFISVSFYK